MNSRPSTYPILGHSVYPQSAFLSLVKVNLYVSTLNRNQYGSLKVIITY
nr:MAG TPA: hypothetical protein [Caudoviricetes sp.]